ncbi:MAG: D-aminoacyl-tRNA deacylase [Hydrogenovibrio sp.]|nr:D-aminoacyl-tRNA deacylase [Hydrogenovibrio sp.]
MISVLQRVSQAQVAIAGESVGEIGPGLMVLCGFQPGDDISSLERMLHKLLHYRVFADADGKMNLNVQQVDGGLLLVPQFTLTADTKKGLRPSFHTSAPPQEAERLFNQFVELANSRYPKIQTGRFGADMQVTLTNDGPVTFQLQT